MVGFCHLTDSHHYHHGQKPTMVGICHGGNMPVGQWKHVVLWRFANRAHAVRNHTEGKVLMGLVLLKKPCHLVNFIGGQPYSHLVQSITEWENKAPRSLHHWFERPPFQGPARVGFWSLRSEKWKKAFTLFRKVKSEIKMLRDREVKILEIS